MNDKVQSLQSLGSKQTKYPTRPDIKILETFKNTAGLIAIPLECAEFTSLCPKTGQPDWATFKIIYVPDQLCVESKSLKLYLFSFRNTGEFHEDVTNRIFHDLWTLLNPLYLSIYGNFNSRGGIAIKPYKAEFAPKVKDDPYLEDLIEILLDHYSKR